MAARAIFPTCWFDAARCEKGLLHALRHYHYAEDPDKEIFSREPVHDWSSHAADAFRYMAIASRDGSSEGRNRKIAGRLQKQNGIFGALQGFGESLGWMG